jgi:hypothetical protein
VQSVIVTLLMLLLAVAVGYFAIMGYLQRRRTFALARMAGEKGLRFSVDDPFDVARRYADFCLLSAGHSAKAHNVTYGRIDQCSLRAFDFRYEVGHGTRRSTRRYNVVVVETPDSMAPVLMWNLIDADNAPLAARQSGETVLAWTCGGDIHLRHALATAAMPFAEDGLSVQTCGSTLMLASPVRRRQDYTRQFEAAAAILSAVRSASAKPGQSPVENVPPTC